MNNRHWIQLLIWSLVLAAIARWPCIPYVNAATLDPNFGLHALSSAPYSGTHPFRIESLNYPDGIPAQFIAIPTLILAKLIAPLWNAVAATHISVWLWLALQGIGTALLFSNQPQRNRYLISTAAILNPIHMVALGNGQWENVAIFPILMVATALKAGRWARFIIGLILCAACSPYILMAGLLCAVPFIKPQLTNWRLYSSIALVSTLCLAYYSGAEDGQTLYQTSTGQHLRTCTAFKSCLSVIRLKMVFHLMVHWPDFTHLRASKTTSTMRIGHGCKPLQGAISGFL